MTRLSNQQIFMAQALIAAEGSTCVRRSVGCVLVDKRNHIMSVGRNGVPSKFAHCTTTPCPGALSAPGTDLDKCLAVHAEVNALLQCQDPMAIEACYTTASPCVHCVKLLLNTSCWKIIYINEYPHPEARDLWLQRERRIWLQMDDPFINSMGQFIQEKIRV